MTFRRIRGWLMAAATNDTDRPIETVVRPDPDEVAREYATTLLAEARDELLRGDQKASILLAAAGVARSGP